ncbi:MAG: hypothetical protein LBI28_10165 [Treponema sp.]|jgi:hypothetical protein|nr:hypothetical protein [Treponema sp.]
MSKEKREERRFNHGGHGVHGGREKRRGSTNYSRPILHSVTVWMNNLNTAWRTRNLTKMKNARRL